MSKPRIKTGFQTHVIDAKWTVTHIVATHLWMEHLLIRSLTAVLARPAALFARRQPSFSQLIDLAEAIDVIEPDFAVVLRCANSLRNKYAHHLSFEPNAKEIEALRKALREMKRPFLIDMRPPTEESVMSALASISGRLEKRARELKATDIDAV